MSVKIQIMEKYKLAVVDDEDEIRESYQDLLGQDYEILSYSSGLAFLEAQKTANFTAPDLVITDLKMPGLDGIEMVRKSQLNDHHFPVILLSGFLDKQSALNAVDIGVYRLLEKPTPVDQLRAAIDQLLVEHEIVKVRKEMTALTSQLRELYSAIRIAVLPYIPEDILNRMIVETKNGNVVRKVSFEQVLEGLEARLDSLVRSERVLQELRQQRYRNHT